MVRSRVVHRGWMVGGRGVVGGWCMVGGGGVVGSRSRGVVGGFWCLSIDSFPFVGDISHIAAVVVSMVGHVLGPAVREQDGVGALHIKTCTTCPTCTISPPQPLCLTSTFP